MKLPPAILVPLLLGSLVALHGADNPFASAKAVWRMTADEAARRQPFALKENGPVKFEPLGAAEAVESRKRGSADTAVTLTTDAFLSLAAAQKELRSRVERWMRDTADPRVDPANDAWDKYPYFGGRVVDEHGNPVKGKARLPK